MRVQAVLWGLLVFAACGSSRPDPIPFARSTITPAAVGEVATTVGPNGNTQLVITVRHLAQPASVVPGATVYVVWATELGAKTGARNLGALQVDSGLNGRLTTVTPLRSFDLAITAEATQTTQAPTSDPVLSVRVAPRS